MQRQAGSPAVGRSEPTPSRRVSCAECGKPAKLVGGKAIYPHRPDLYAKSFWRCDCGAYVGCHPGSNQALGSPAGPITRAARSAAHAAFDPIWRGKKLSRPEAYSRLAAFLGIERAACHIGMMDAATARRVPSFASGAAALARRHDAQPTHGTIPLPNTQQEPNR